MPALRAILAVLLTALFTGVTSAIALCMASAAPGQPVFQWELLSLLAFFGVIAAFPCAVLLGIIAELPKAYLLSRHRLIGSAAALLVSIAISIAVAQVMLSIWLAIFPPRSAQIVSPAQLNFPTIAFTIGGAYSALFWWVLVVVPWRRSAAFAADYLGMRQ